MQPDMDLAGDPDWVRVAEVPMHPGCVLDHPHEGRCRTGPPVRADATPATDPEG